MKALNNIERIQFNNETLLQLLPLYECKGKEFYYNDLFQRDSAAFEKNTLEMDVYAIGKILDLDVTEARLKQWSKKALTPKNKDEELLRNIRIVLERLQTNISQFEFFSNELFDLGRGISKGIGQFNYLSYPVEGAGTLSKTKSKRYDLEELINLFEKLKNGKKNELIQLMCNFYIDFLNMDIFNSFNKEIGLIFLYTLLSLNFNVFRYISFFTYFLEKKEIIRQATIQAAYYWKEGYAQTETLFRVMVDILNSAYSEIEKIAHEYDFERTLNKSNSIENTITKLSSIFSKEDIRRLHPTVSDKTIDRTLKRLKDENKITPLGKGRTSRWQRVNDDDAFFGKKQLSMFKD